MHKVRASLLFLIFPLNKFKSYKPNIEIKMFKQYGSIYGISIARAPSQSPTAGGGAAVNIRRINDR